MSYKLKTSDIHKKKSFKQIAIQLIWKAHYFISVYGLVKASITILKNSAVIRIGPRWEFESK